jgi:hypothetical protein
LKDVASTALSHRVKITEIEPSRSIQAGVVEIEVKDS